ncbi:MAG: hypothetical protein R2764_08235 [Bacteroidales bacterium]
MKQNNFIYSIKSTSNKSKHEFDLNDLGNSVYRGMSMAFVYGDGRVEGGDIWTSPPEQKDYDKELQKTILKLNPIYKIPDFLDYHYKHYCKTNKPALFISHIKYVILDYFDQINKKPIIELIKNWITKIEKMNLLEFEKQKYDFLCQAYEIAIKEDPEDPLSAWFNTQELGKEMQIEIHKMEELVISLCDDGYLSSTLGLLEFHITTEGYRYLLVKEKEKFSPNDSKSISISGNSISNINIQQDTTQSQQIIVPNIEIEEIKGVVELVKSNISIIQKHLPEEHFEDFEDELRRLEKQIKKYQPDKSKIQRTMNEIAIYLKKIPSQVITSFLSKSLLKLFGL